MHLSQKVIRLFRQNEKTSSKGFTLIELVVVIGILVILFAIVLIAINPGRQFRQANDTKRRSDTSALLNAISQYAADNEGALPVGITTTVQNISLLGANLCYLISPTYISALPFDPSAPQADVVTDCIITTAYDTHYQVVKDAAGRVTVSAPDTEEASPDISITR